jgi:hypothetical protein
MAAVIRPQVGGHGLLQGEESEAALVDLDLQLVDLLVGARDLLGAARFSSMRACIARCTRSSTRAPMLRSRFLSACSSLSK